jgi:hypothetical protein
MKKIFMPEEATSIAKGEIVDGAERREQGEADTGGRCLIATTVAVNEVTGAEQ